MTTTAATLTLLMEFAFRGLVLLTAAFLVNTLLLRRHSAAVRHAVWCGAMVSLLALPVLSLVLPAWRVLPGFDPAALEDPHRAALTMPQLIVQPRIIAVQPPQPRAEGRTYEGHVIPIPIEPRVTLPPDTSPLPTMTVDPSQLTYSPTVSWQAAATPPTTPDGNRRAAWLSHFPTVYALGVVVALLPLIAGTLRLRRLSREAKPVTDFPTLDLLRDLCARLGVRRGVKLLASDRWAMPITWGTVCPKVMVPASILDPQTDPSRLRVVLLHELSHVKRCDCLWQLLASAACALHWFNPLVWLAARCMLNERERACDDLVLTSGQVKPSDYAQHLMDIAAGLRQRLLPTPTLPGVPMARRSTLHSRLLAILDATRNRHAMTRSSAAAATLLLIGLVLPLAMVSGMEEPKEVQPPGPTSQGGGPGDADTTSAPTAERKIEPTPPDEVTEALRELVQIAESKAHYLRQLAEQDRASEVEVFDAEANLAETRIRLAERSSNETEVFRQLAVISELRLKVREHLKLMVANGTANEKALLEAEEEAAEAKLRWVQAKEERARGKRPDNTTVEPMAIAADPEDPEGRIYQLIRRAASLRKELKYKEAVAVLDQALELEPANPVALAMKEMIVEPMILGGNPRNEAGHVLLKLQKIARGEGVQRVLELQEQRCMRMVIPPLTSLSSEDRERLREPMTKQAIGVLERELAKEGHDPGAFRTLIEDTAKEAVRLRDPLQRDKELETYLKQAAELRKELKYVEAIKALDEALLLQPDNIILQAMKEMLEEALRQKEERIRQKATP